MLIKLFLLAISSWAYNICNFSPIHCLVRNFGLRLTHPVTPNPSSIHLKYSPENQFSTCIPAPSSLSYFLCEHKWAITLDNTEDKGSYNDETPKQRQNKKSWGCFWCTFFKNIYRHSWPQRQEKLYCLMKCCLAEILHSSWTRLWKLKYMLSEENKRVL